MEVESFLTARFAEQTREGLTNLIGGGLTAVVVPLFPFRFPSLYVAAKLSLGRGETEVPHKFKVRLTSPAGQTLVETEEFQTPAIALPPDSEQMSVNLSLGFPGIEFVERGSYTFALIYDDQTAKMSTLRLELKRDIDEGKVSVMNAAEGG